MVYSDDFERSVKFVLDAEGGYVCDPDDPGGATNFGISQRAYPHLDIKALTVDAAKEIYYNDYWLRTHCDKEKWPLNLILFDTTVNMGEGEAWRILNKVSSCTNESMANEYLSRREAVYEEIAASKPKDKKYLKGWLNRLSRLKLYIETHKEATNG